MHPDLSQEGITDTAVHRELLFFYKISRWRIFYRPEMVSTGTGNDWSGIRCTATEDNALIPRHPKGWLDEAIR
jgi:hypothetical protein